MIGVTVEFKLLAVPSSCEHCGIATANTPCNGNQSMIKIRKNLRTVSFILSVQILFVIVIYKLAF